MLRTGARPNLQQIRVLVVDDDPDVCDVVASILVVHGADVECAMSAAGARQRLGQRAFDVLLSDIDMPEEDGLTFVRWLRASDAPVQAIRAAALTARASPSDRAAAADAGFDRLIAKPFDMITLVRAVEDLAHPR